MTFKISTGLYEFNLHSEVNAVYQTAKLIYGDVPEKDRPDDFQINIVFESFIRRFLKPQISFICDQHSPFKPLPVSQAPAILEWGMNWCIAAHEYGKLIIHAAVLVKNDQAIVLPALPGSGKSTLTAYLGLAGWATYSDEMAIINTHNGRVEPLFRPVCLKNDSISLIKKWHPHAIVSPICRDTQKGDVAHVKVLSWQDYQALQPVPVVAVVFPKYQASSELTIYQLSQLDAFNTLSANAFNYNVLGAAGFDAVKKIICNSRQFEISFNDVKEVDAFLSEDIIK